MKCSIKRVIFVTLGILLMITMISGTSAASDNYMINGNHITLVGTPGSGKMYVLGAGLSLGNIMESNLDQCIKFIQEFNDAHGIGVSDQSIGECAKGHYDNRVAIKAQGATSAKLWFDNGTY